VSGLTVETFEYEEGDNGFVMFTDPNFKLHMHKIVENETGFSYKMIGGLTAFLPYSPFSVEVNWEFKKATNVVTISYSNFKNLKYGGDSQKEIFDQDIKSQFLENYKHFFFNTVWDNMMVKTKNFFGVLMCSNSN